MKAPLTLRLGLLNYPVKVLEQEDAYDKNWACIDFQNIEIRVDPKRPPAHQASLLIHELIHACYWNSGNAGAEMSEEDVCVMLDRQLTLIFRDNPALFTVLAAALQRDKPVVTT